MLLESRDHLGRGPGFCRRRHRGPSMGQCAPAPLQRV